MRCGVVSRVHSQEWLCYWRRRRCLASCLLFSRRRGWWRRDRRGYGERGAGGGEEAGREVKDEADGFGFAAIDAGDVGSFEDLQVGIPGLRVKL